VRGREKENKSFKIKFGWKAYRWW